MNIYTALLGSWTTLILIYVTTAVIAFSFQKKRTDDLVHITWKSLLLLYLALLFAPLMAIIILFFMVYKRLVHKILTFMSDENYGGLLNADDVVYAIENAKDSKVKVLFVVGYEKNNSISFYNYVKAVW
ncbi:hypothetical protein RN001_005358 [Aquatica leii]|uniref:Uncharacterized protein n=1 Tax=Aquatica leii TaxID=1421715 RepID=A0AAN7PCD6_9COLE|nr:hypothetical protein RN001_005358 [Aquatica leii]